MKNIIYSLVLIFALSKATNLNAQTRPKVKGYSISQKATPRSVQMQEAPRNIEAMQQFVLTDPTPTVVYECGKSMKNIAGTVPRKGMVNDGTIRVRITNNVTSNYKLVTIAEGNMEYMDIVYNKVSGNLGFPILMYVSTLQDLTGSAILTGTVNGIPVDNVSKSYNIRLDSSPISCPFGVE
jgi:hypothetical protein